MIRELEVLTLLVIGGSLVMAALIGRWWGGLTAWIPISLWVVRTEDFDFVYDLWFAAILLLLLAVPSAILVAARDPKTGKLIPQVRAFCLVVGLAALYKLHVVVSRPVPTWPPS